MLEKYMHETYIMDICKNIGMYEEAVQDLLRVMKSYDMGRYEDVFQKMLDRATMYEAAEELHEKVEPEKDGGYRCLLLYLAATGYTHERYRELGISDAVFYNTMDAFREYVNTYKEANGTYGFAVTTWPVRHINCVLFQLGRLGFEMYDYDEDVYEDGVCIIRKGDPTISVHIPANGKLNHDMVLEAYAAARVFFKTYFPAFVPQYFVCGSWLLDTRLWELLPEVSNILKFQSDFTIYKLYEGADAPLTRVFGHAYEDLDRYTPHTTLEKNMVAYLKAGKPLGGGRGYFRY